MVDAATAIYAIPELASFGRVFRSCPSIPLTESETEYVVYCIKHILDEHVILQFQVQNTIEDQRLENATVDVIPEDGSAYEVIGEIPADGIRYGEIKRHFRHSEAQWFGVILLVSLQHDVPCGLSR